MLGVCNAVISLLSIKLTSRQFLERIILSCRCDNRVRPTPSLSYLSGKVSAVEVRERSMRSENVRRGRADAGTRAGGQRDTKSVYGTARRTAADGRRSTDDGDRLGSRPSRSSRAVEVAEGTQLLTALLIASTDSRQKLIDRSAR